MKPELSRSNNAGLIKFFASLLLIVSHAFPLSVYNGADWLERVTRGHLSLGGLAVAIFFFLSGLLVTNSLLNKPDIPGYFTKRAERIFPPLFCVVLVCVFVLGPIMSVLDTRSYFSNAETYRYLLNGICVLQHNLPGVFEGNVYGSVVNGALWTMPLEVAGYIVIVLAYRFKLLTGKAFSVIAAIAFLGWCFIAFFISEPLIYVSYRACLMFCFGMLARVFWDKIVFRKAYMFASLIVLVCTASTVIFPILFVILFPYILICLCWVIPQIPEWMGRGGNISYGIYLVGFPIQQTVVYLFGGSMSPCVNIIISIPIAVILGGIIIVFTDRIITTRKQ